MLKLKATTVILTVCGTVCAIWAYIAIPEVAVDIPGPAQGLPRVVEHGPAVWALATCLALIGLLNLVMEFFPSVAARLRSYRVATGTAVLAVLVLIMWKGWL